MVRPPENAAPAHEPSPISESRRARYRVILGSCSIAVRMKPMSVLPLWSPPRCSTRGREWAASRALPPSNLTPSDSSQRTVPGPAEVSIATALGSQRSPPAASVSRACSRGESSGSVAAAIPPCARSDEPCAAETSATEAPRRAASSAAAEPARPSPITSRSVRVTHIAMSSQREGEQRRLPGRRPGRLRRRRDEREPAGSLSYFNHSLNRSARLVGDFLRNRDLEHVFAQGDQQFFERDLLHVPADRALAGRVEAALRRFLRQPVHDTELGRDDKAAGRVLLRVLDHAFGAEDVRAVGIYVAVRLEIHALAGAAAFRVDQQVRVAMLAASAVDVDGPDAGVDVTLALPHVHRAAGHLLEVGAEKHVGQKEDLFVFRDCADHALRIPRRAAVVAQRLHFGGGVYVRNDDRARVFGLPGSELGGVDGVGQRAARRQVWNEHSFGRTQDRRRLGHEVDSAEHDYVGVRCRSLAGKPERVADILRRVRREVDLLYRHVLVTSRLTSSAGAECVSAPTEIRSTPAFAAATAPSSVIPPDASNLARPAVISTLRRRSSGDMLSSRMISAPASSASCSCSTVSTSTSIGIRARRARSIAAVTPPAAATWLSLIRIASHRPWRWLCPPPARTAARSRNRSPGVVLRVSRSLTAG